MLVGACCCSVRRAPGKADCSARLCLQDICSCSVMQGAACSSQIAKSGIRHWPGAELLGRQRRPRRWPPSAHARWLPAPGVSQLQRPGSWCCAAWQSLTGRDCRCPKCPAGECQQFVQLRCSTASHQSSWIFPGAAGSCHCLLRTACFVTMGIQSVSNAAEHCTPAVNPVPASHHSRQGRPGAAPAARLGPYLPWLRFAGM